MLPTDNMPLPQTKAPIKTRLRSALLRLAMILLVAAAIGTALNALAAALDRNSHPAGFARGLLQGALMPMALPNLLVGRDVSIYSANNTGVPYKLGYTAGVNACGAIFFGFFYWRLNRLHHWARARR